MLSKLNLQRVGSISFGHIEPGTLSVPRTDFFELSCKTEQGGLVPKFSHEVSSDWQAGLGLMEWDGHRRLASPVCHLCTGYELQQTIEYLLSSSRQANLSMLDWRYCQSGRHDHVIA